MSNRWKIPEWLEKEVRARDTVCVYCGTQFSPDKESRKSFASWEHIINDATIITRENIALCCCSCNASKGSKGLSAWLNSSGSKQRGVNQDTLARVIKSAIRNGQ